jgi:hypothetical protein
MRLALPKFGDVNRSIFCRGGDRAEYSTAPTSPTSLLFVVVVDIFFTGLIVVVVIKTSPSLLLHLSVVANCPF